LDESLDEITPLNTTFTGTPRKEMYAGTETYEGKINPR
jgi:hypothetical protein